MGHAQAVQEVCQSLFPIYMTRRKACRIQVSTAIQGGIRPAALGRVGCRYRNILLHMATVHAMTTTSKRLVSSSQPAAGDLAASRLSSSRLCVTAEAEARQVLGAKVRISTAKGGGHSVHLHAHRCARYDCAPRCDARARTPAFLYPQ